MTKYVCCICDKIIKDEIKQHILTKHKREYIEVKDFMQLGE
jgi:hypothetical protein